MKKILLVKITSMGDLIQMLPALSDAAHALPGIQFDWLVEDSFQDIPRLHPSVARIIALPYRRWKKNLKPALQSGEITRFLKTVRHQSYDMIIDAQSNLKSAVVSCLAKGKRYGLDKSSVSEYGAQFFYHHSMTIDRNQNHAERLRQMMAHFLSYPLPNTPADYGIVKDNLPKLNIALPEKFVLITHIASVSNKLWPESYWQIVLADLLRSGYELVLPWWSQTERERALRLQNQDSRIHLLPSVTLLEKATVLSKATAALSLDTGLAHLAAALGIPNVSLYGPGNAKTCGTLGEKQVHISAQSPACSPCESMRCHYQGETAFEPACMATIQPQQVLAAFYALMQ